jgi:hypothetical protein
MAWLEGLSSLKGQITSFTKEVLSEGRDEIHGNSHIFFLELYNDMIMISSYAVAL